MRASPQARHPYVWRKPGVCGGAPVLRGTRFPVRSIVLYILRQGMPPEDMVRDWPYLKLAHVYDALSFYYDHKIEIDREIRANERAFEKGWRAATPVPGSPYRISRPPGGPKGVGREGHSRRS